MKLLTTALFSVLPSALFSGLAVAVSKASNAETCLLNHPNIYNAINDFCYVSNLVVPSTYASAGKKSGTKWVGIQGNCSPAQWVPSQYCVSQMQQLCATAGRNGENSGYWGRNNCQHFVVTQA